MNYLHKTLFLMVTKACLLVCVFGCETGCHSSTSTARGNRDNVASARAKIQPDSKNKPFVKAEWDGGSTITVTVKRLPKEYYYKPAVCWGYGQQNQQNRAEELWATRTYLPRIGFARLGCMISHGMGPELSRALFPYKTVDESGKWVVLEILMKKALRTDDAVFTFDLVYPEYRKPLLMGSSVLLPRYLYLLPVDQTHPERFRIGKVRKESMDSAEEDSKILVAEIQRK